MVDLKERERADLDALYQSLSSEATTLESHAVGAFETNAAVRTELATEANRARRLEAEVQALSLEVVSGEDRKNVGLDPSNALHPYPSCTLGHALTRRCPLPQEIEARNSALLAELHAVEQRDRTTQQELDGAKRELEAARGVAQLAAEGRDDAEKRMVELAAQLDDLQRDAEGSGQEAAVRAQQVDAAQIEAADLQRQLEDLRNDLCMKEGELDRTAAENKALKRSVDDLMSRIEAFSSQVHTRIVFASMCWCQLPPEPGNCACRFRHSIPKRRRRMSVRIGWRES
jgi:uncharacterized protein YoxC